MNKTQELKQNAENYINRQELQTFDRGGEDLSALVTCDSCRSYIWVQHPKLAAPGTPVFPLIPTNARAASPSP